jgi:hypothetical protein
LIRRRRRNPARRGYNLRFPRNFGAQPLSRNERLQYVQVEVLPNLAAATLYSREWRANDLYDPDYAVGGHQPHGFDQLMAQYYHFTVLYSTIEVEILSIVDNKNVIYGIWQTNAHGTVAAAYAASGVNGILELQPHTHSSINTMEVYGVPDRQRTLKLSFNGPRVFHKTAANMIGDSRYQGSETASPIEDAMYEVCGFHPNGAAAAFSDACIKFTITYSAVFTEPRAYASS